MNTLRGDYVRSLTSVAQYNRNRAQRKKADGICTECTALVESGKSMCRKHLDLFADRVKKTAEWKQQNGYCIKGGCWERSERTLHCERHRIARLKEKPH